MTNFYYITQENTKEHNSNWSEISDHPCRTLITESSESRKKFII